MAKLLQCEGVKVDRPSVSRSMDGWRSSGSSLRQKLRVARLVRTHPPTL